MNAPRKFLPDILSEGYREATFIATVVDALDWVPELKHEGLVCTHLSSALRKRGVASMREVTVGRRRYDIKIEDCFVEAKYHFEGDLHDVLTSFRPESNYVYNPKGWNSAPKSIHDELNRGEPSWFLWMVCVRTPESNENYIYRDLIGRFQNSCGATDFDSSIAAAELLMARDCTSVFQARLATLDYDLPTIRGRHSALVSRLYHLAAYDA